MTTTSTRNAVESPTDEISVKGTVRIHRLFLGRESRNARTINIPRNSKPRRYSLLPIPRLLITLRSSLA